MVCTVIIYIIVTQPTCSGDLPVTGSNRVGVRQRLATLDDDASVMISVQCIPTLSVAFLHDLV